MIQGLYKTFDHWHKEGTLFIISDTHFGDADIRRGFPDRPADDELVKRINSYVGRKDSIIFLGDVGDLTYVKQLRAKYKILIMGNHDCGHTNYERQVITQMFSKDLYSKEQVLDLMKTMYPNCRYSIKADENIITADGFMFWEAAADNMLFDEVYEGPLMISEKLILSHEPIDVSWAFNLHGHIHDLKHKNDKYHFNVCSDAIGYMPVNMNQWMKQGYLSHIESIHRATITSATIKAKKRGHKLSGQK